MQGYLVLGRRSFEEPLMVQGRLEAATDEQAVEAARATYGEDWVELTALASASVRWILGSERSLAGAQETSS